MSNMNFFSWIRDGVRQSVMLGVSDAIEQLGTPAATKDLHPSVAGFLQVESATSQAPKLSTQPGGHPKTKKRLGKSLQEIGHEADHHEH